MFRCFLTVFFGFSLFNCFVKCFVLDTVECSPNSPIYNFQNNNTLLLLQTPEFPQRYVNAPCNVKLRTNIPDTFIWIAMLNGAAEELLIQDDGHLSNKLIIPFYKPYYDTVSFSTQSNSLSIFVNGTENAPEWTAYQAVATAFSKDLQASSCPFSSQIFNLKENSNLVIPISAKFGSNEIKLSNKICTWQFTVGLGQQLKIVSIKMDTVDEINLSLKNDTTNIYNFTKKDNNNVKYFSGFNFNLTYEFNFGNSSDPTFFLLVSAVTTAIRNITDKCSVQKDDTYDPTIITTFHNRDLINGYPPNQFCSTSIKISELHEGTIKFNDIDYEIFVDKLFLLQGNQRFDINAPEKHDIGQLSYILTSDINDAELIFTSDANTQGAGFNIDITTYPCVCSNFTAHIPCDENKIEISPTSQDSYCSNMNCNYTILPNPLCLKAYFHIEFTNFLRVTVDDFVEIRWNGNVDLNVTSKQMSIINRYYSPPSNMTLQFHSGPSPKSITSEMQQWHLKLTSIITPIFVRKTLDQTTPKYVQWLADMGENDALTVCTLNGTLELLFTGDENTNLSEFLLYDSNDVNNFVGSLNSFLRASNPWLPARIQSTSKCFTLYVPLKSYAKSYTALFRIIEYSNLNCRGANNVFQVPYTYTYPPEYDVSVQSTTLGSCEMIILSSTGYFSNDLPHIWIKNISADSDSMYLFKSGINDKKLMNLNGSEASQWQSFGIYTSALIIVLPPSATITLHLSYYFLPREQINILKNGTQKGIMVSPSYCGFLKSFGNSSLYSSDNVISQISLNLDVKNIYGTLFPLLEYGIGQRLTINQSTNISSTGFNLYFNDNGKSKDNGFLIKYTIKPMVYDFDPTKTKPSEAAKRTAMGFIILIIITVIFLV